MASSSSSPSSLPVKQEYSTLEVDTSQHNHSNDLEVNRNATADRDYPEVAPNKSEGPFVVGAGVQGAAAKRICGLRRRYWIAIVVLTVIAVVAIVVGVVIGTRNNGHDSTEVSSPTPTASGDGADQTLLLSNTKLSSANFTDEYDNQNYIVVYQLESRAIYMSCFNSSKEEWIVSPIVDGTGDFDLDDVRGGTDFSIDIYWHNTTWRDVHLYWQSPTNAVKSLFRQSIRTDKKSTPDDWSDPFSSDRYSAANGSDIVSYGRQCSECVLYTYVFFQDANDGLYGGVLFHSNADGWTDRNFSDVATPAKNSSLSLVSVPAQNLSDRGLSLFYESESGVLTQLLYDGDDTYSSSSLPRGLGENSTILAFSTGMNGTDLTFQVLTTSPDSDDGVQLTYQQDGSWTSGVEVSALSSCVGKSAMALNYAQRVYCVVETSESKLEIVEWEWKGDVSGSEDTFSSWDKVGTVNTTVK